MNYAKALAALVAAVLSGVAAALTGDSVIDITEWLNVIILGVGVLTTFVGPNVPGAVYTKSILAGLSAVLVLAVNLVGEGIDMAEWIQLGIAFVGALGVLAVPNGPAAPAHVVDGQHAA